MADVTKANEGMVSSIGDNDLVMCVASNGGYHPVSFANLAKLVRGSLHIGGRNLLSIPTNSNATVSVANGVVTFLGNRDTYFNINYANPSLMVVGETYTLSFDCEGVIDGNAWYLSGVANANIFSILLKNGRCSATFVLNNTQFSAGSTAFGFDDTVRNLPNGFSPVRLSNFKLERGNVATDWTPAPEDIASGLWGGVIGYLPITYDIDSQASQEGGLHELDNNAKSVPICFDSCSRISMPCEGWEFLYYDKAISSHSHVADALCEDLYEDWVQYLDKGTSAENNKSRFGLLGRLCGCERGRCDDHPGTDEGHESKVRLVLLCNFPKRSRIHERQIFPVAHGRRATDLAKYRVVVNKRKEVAV